MHLLLYLKFLYKNEQNKKLYIFVKNRDIKNVIKYQKVKNPRNYFYTFKCEG